MSPVHPNKGFATKLTVFVIEIEKPSVLDTLGTQLSFGEHLAKISA
jgi:hypothetical protein